eukprot:scaffold95681_cov31-Tisochrysis_lutea.AAC.2
MNVPAIRLNIAPTEAEQDHIKCSAGAQKLVVLLVAVMEGMAAHPGADHPIGQRNHVVAVTIARLVVASKGGCSKRPRSFLATLVSADRSASKGAARRPSAAPPTSSSTWWARITRAFSIGSGFARCTRCLAKPPRVIACHLTAASCSCRSCFRAIVARGGVGGGGAPLPTGGGMGRIPASSRAGCAGPKSGVRGTGGSGGRASSETVNLLGERDELPRILPLLRRLLRRGECMPMSLRRADSACAMISGPETFHTTPRDWRWRTMGIVVM